ncbi:MAG: hypothetical protein ACD_21C00156G0010 [uncultured bacterium]|nr:MAG: hypothetical protein ACD_21C00156G0010 [uncultured bacterium]
MRNKALIFLALMVFGLVGCNKEAADVKEAGTEQQKEVVVSDMNAVSEDSSSSITSGAPESDVPEEEQSN